MSWQWWMTLLAVLAGLLAAAVYTQLSDVEDELNGFVSYDRRVVKVPAAQMQALARALDTL